MNPRWWEIIRDFAVWDAGRKFRSRTPFRLSRLLETVPRMMYPTQMGARDWENDQASEVNQG